MGRSPPGTFPFLDHLIPRESPHDREDTRIDVFRTPDERFAALPAIRSRRTGSRSDGLRMHYVDEGAGEPGAAAARRADLVVPLAQARSRRSPQRHRVVAPDLIGFGRSDKPTDSAGTRTTVTSRRSSGSSSALGLERLTLVVHDWGGPIGLRFAVEHAELVDRIVILDTGIAGGKPPSETWLRFRDVVREVGGELDIGRLVEAGTAQGLSDEVRAAYDAPFPTPESKAGSLAFPELVADRAGASEHRADEPRARRAWRAGRSRCSSSGATRTPCCCRASPSTSSS